MTRWHTPDYRRRLQHGWSESTLYRWWVGASGPTPNQAEMLPRQPVVVALLWLLVVLAIS